MVKAVKENAKTNAKGNNVEPLEKQLWKAADKLRKNIDAAEYKHVVMGLIFLKYISDSFEEMFARLQAGKGEYKGADPEDKDEYKAENVFFVPSEARWTYLVARAKLPAIGTVVDEAMDAIEKENPSLKGVLPKVFARQNLDPASLGGLIDLVGNIALGDAKSRSADVRVERLMQENDIRAKHKRHFKVTTDSKHNLPIAPNLLSQPQGQLLGVRSLPFRVQCPERKFGSFKNERV